LDLTLKVGSRGELYTDGIFKLTDGAHSLFAESLLLLGLEERWWGMLRFIF
jgi:hypothetical protein